MNIKLKTSTDFQQIALSEIILSISFFASGFRKLLCPCLVNRKGYSPALAVTMSEEPRPENEATSVRPKTTYWTVEVYVQL